MSFTDLLDELSTAGSKLAQTPPESQDGPIADARNEVNSALLPVWQWLDGLKAAATDNNVDWVALDDAPSADSVDRVRATVELLTAEVERGNAAGLRSELNRLSSLLQRLDEETDAKLKELGVPDEARHRLLLPLRRHLSGLAVTLGSSEALSLARESLGQVGERRLSEGIAEQVHYERTRADAFRFGAIGAFVISIGWLIASYVAFRHVSDTSGRLEEALTRLAIGSAVLILAVYLAREATQHRRRANGWRSVELQMDTVNLYCASLPAAHRDTIRLAFGLEVFSGSKLFASLDRTESGNGGVDGTPTASVDAEKALDLLKQVGGERLP